MLKIWEEKEAPKKEYFLRLVTDWADRPALAIVDEDGEPIRGGYILNVQADVGCIYLCRSTDKDVFEAVGLKLDSNGRAEIKP